MIKEDGKSVKEKAINIIVALSAFIMLSFKKKHFTLQN